MFWFWGWFIGFYHIHVNAIKHQYSWGYYTIIEWIWCNITIWFHSKPNHPLPQSLSPIGVSEIEDRNPRNGILIWLVNGMVYGIGFATLDQSFVFEWPLGWWTTEPIERPRVVSSCARYFKVAPQYCFSKLHHWQLAKLYIQEEKPFPGIQQFEHQNQNHPCIKFPFFTIADGWIPYVTVKCPRSFSLPNIPDETHVTCVDMEDEPQAPGTCMWEIDLTVGNLKILWNSNSIRLWCKYTQYN